MDAAALRERRKARIQSGGASRLAKITKTTRPEAEDYKDHKVPIQTLNSEKSISGSIDGIDGGIELNSLTEPTGFDANTGMPTDFANDPLFKLLSEMRAQSSSEGGIDNNSGGFPTDPLADPLAAFSSIFGGGDGPGFGDMPGFNNPTATPISPKPKKSDIFWSLIHVLTSISLSIYFLLSRNSLSSSSIFPFNSSLLILFGTSQIILHSSRFILEKGSPPSNSKIVSLASFLPNPFRQYVITVARYLHIGRVLIEDLCIVLFILGVYFGLGGGYQEATDKYEM